MSDLEGVADQRNFPNLQSYLRTSFIGNGSRRDSHHSGVVGMGLVAFSKDFWVNCAGNFDVRWGLVLGLQIPKAAPPQLRIGVEASSYWVAPLEVDQGVPFRSAPHALCPGWKYREFDTTSPRLFMGWICVTELRSHW